ncbi:Conserved_hypothetical protein [Hexamita inflata]|uniref:Uncharacterized protein n=1 Tax=Hexamita inflata TaxID=28002 RepID=A0AA86N9M7_9EUKA|nr:Conserved hypothetical protein [Hexamita inflata]
MLQLAIILCVDTCITYDDYNAIYTIHNPHLANDMYIALLVNYLDWNPTLNNTRYVSTDVPAGQTEINVTFYGSVHTVCTDEASNINKMHDVAKVEDIFDYGNMAIVAPYVVFVNPDYRRCWMADTNDNWYYIDMTSGMKDVVLNIIPITDIAGYHFDYTYCQRRVYMDGSAPNGVLQAKTYDVIFPVFNAKLREYNSEGGDFLYPLVYINSSIEANIGYYSTPTNQIDGISDEVWVGSSVLFGREFVLDNLYVMAGNDSRFENVTITGNCVYFYANSPRIIEYPINSGIIIYITSWGPQYDMVSKVYTQYYGPMICVNSYTYMPAFFLTKEDPALRTLCNNLPAIQANFTSHVNAGTWEYLGANKDVNLPENKKAIAYTQAMIDKLTDTCQEAYFFSGYLMNLSNTFSIVAILFFATLMVYIIVRLVLTKMNTINQFFAHINEAHKRKRFLIELLCSGFLAILVLILLLTVKQATIQLLVIMSIFIVSLITFGYFHYHRVPSEEEEEENEDAVEAAPKARHHIPTIVFQFVVSVAVDTLESLLTITDILQMLQYMKFQYYQNRIQNIGWLMYPADQILSAAQYLSRGIYPFVFLIVSLVNQEIMKSDWFKLIIQKPEDPLDTSSFLLKKLLKLFSYYQGFTYNVFFAFTDKQLTISFFSNQTANNNLQVIVKMFLAGTLYSISKYNLLMEYYEQINKMIVKVFMQLAQIQANVFTFVATPIRLFWFLATGKWKKLSDSLQMFCWSVVSTAYYAFMLVLDPVVTLLFPTTLMLQDFMFPCPFLLQIFGIVDHQDVIAKQTSLLLAMDLPSVLRRFVVAVQAGAVSLFFSLLFTQDQEATINPKKQWHCFIFAGTMVLTSVVSTNQIGQLIAKQQAKFGDKISTLQAVISEKQSRFHESLLKVHGNYAHKMDQFEEYLRGFIFAGYGNIPGCGPLLSCVAKFMGATCLASGGVWEFDVSILLNLSQFVFIVLTVYWALKVDNETMYFLGWFSAYVMLQLFQDWKDVMEDFNEKLTVAYQLDQLLKCKKISFKRLNEKNEIIQNREDVSSKVEHNQKILNTSSPSKVQNGSGNILVPSLPTVITGVMDQEDNHMDII